MKARDHLQKLMLLFGMIFIYLLFGTSILLLVNAGVIPHAKFIVPVVDNSTDTDIVPTPVNPTASLSSAIMYVQNHLRRPSGHINLYLPLHGQTLDGANDTNSEAISYYLLAMVQNNDKQAFDKELDYLETKMIHTTGSYLMWRLNDEDVAVGDGVNIAPDADLRALHALYDAKDLWGDPRYDVDINRIATGLERVAIDDNNVLVAYGGMSGDKPWRADESYLGYSDFQVYDRLANTRGGIWYDVAKKMRNITLDAQIWNGLYNTVYFIGRPEGKQYGTSIDGGVYSINSLWIMVRFAGSGDPELMASARKSLKFYQEQYAKDGKIYNAYTSSGEPANHDESPWNYALIARAAYLLDEKSFAQLMERRMLDYQETDKSSPEYGAIIEGAVGSEVVGQFTMEECILTMQESQGKAPKFTD